MTPCRAEITGLVLAGGQGRRMGGVDKGLQRVGGQRLACLALDRLRPQVATCLVSANRHLDQYAAFGVPVVTDGTPGHPGPLAGLLAGLQAATTDWLLAVPCDSPAFPHDLAERLAVAVAGRPVAMAATVEADGRHQHQPVFCLVQRALAPDLARFINAGGASPWAWASSHGVQLVPFADAAAFFNANTPEDLQRLVSGPTHHGHRDGPTRG